MKKRFSFVKNFPWLFLSFSMITIIWWIFVILNSFRLSIEFTWGIKLTVNKELQINKQDFVDNFKDINPDITTIAKEWNTVINFRSLLPDVDYNDAMLSKVKNYLQEKKYIESPENIVWTSFIWPSIGEFMKSAAKTALIWWMIIMGIYVFIAFVWVRKYFAPWIFSLVTVVALLHDVIMASAWYWIWMMINPTAVIDSIFVMSILTILWYSVNDTIIIFDRIRENIIKYDDVLRKWTMKLMDIFDDSLYQVFRRSLLTSFSTLLVLLCMYLFGNDTLKDFSLVIFVWVLFGTYSSVFLAAPAAYRINRFITKKE